MAYEICQQCKGQRMHYALGALMIKCKACLGLGRTEVLDEKVVDNYLAADPASLSSPLILEKPKRGRKPNQKKES